MNSAPKPKSHPKVLAKKKKIRNKNVKNGSSKGEDTQPTVKKIKGKNFARQRILAKKQKKDVDKKQKKGVDIKQVLEKEAISSLVINQAIQGIRTLEMQLHEKKGKDLLGDEGDDGLMYLQVGMVKVSDLLPVKHVIRPVRIRVHLPHSVVNSETEVLLITRDEDNKKKRQLRQDFSEHLNKFQEMLRMCGASQHINEVMTLRQLKVEYKEYEGKRHLANRVDVVLVDDTIIRRIPLFLGKHFYKRRKFPIQVNLKAKDVLAEVEKALTQQVLWLPMTGTSAIMTIGRLTQTDKMIEENIRAALQKFREKFPGGWTNIQSLSLKTIRSKTVPFYAKLSEINEITPIEPKPLYTRGAVVGEVNTFFGKSVHVNPDGTYKVITRDEMKRRQRKEKKQELEANKTKPKKKKKATDNKSKIKKESLVATKKKKKAPKESSDVPKKKFKVSGEEEESKTESKYDSMDVEDLDKMEMEYLKRISMKQEVEKNEGKSSKTKIVPNEDSDDAWAEFSDEDILSDYCDEL